eukprot:scaffold170300_cov34-Tisochrysis_lutea.AAC.1
MRVRVTGRHVKPSRKYKYRSMDDEAGPFLCLGWLFWFAAQPYAPHCEGPATWHMASWFMVSLMVDGGWWYAFPGVSPSPPGVLSLVTRVFLFDFMSDSVFYVLRQVSLPSASLRSLGLGRCRSSSVRPIGSRKSEVVDVDVDARFFGCLPMFAWALLEASVLLPNVGLLLKVNSVEIEWRGRKRKQSTEREPNKERSRQPQPATGTRFEIRR